MKTHVVVRQTQRAFLPTLSLRPSRGVNLLALSLLALSLILLHTAPGLAAQTVAAWGRNTEGQLGEGTMTNEAYPSDITNKGALSGKTVIQISAGFMHSLALCSDGTLASWGYNGYGQLGTGDNTDRSLPVAITNNGALNGKTISQIQCGRYHNMVLCSDGTLVGWGHNGYGELGIDNFDAQNLPVTCINRMVLNGKTISKLVVGNHHNLVLCNDGTLAAWGANIWGALGDGTLNTSNVLLNVTGNGALAGKTVTQIVAGSDHTLALCSDGTVAAWGYNVQGELGDGTGSRQASPVNITGNGALNGKTVTGLVAGQSDSFALCSDGTLAAWGANGSGQLGDGTGVDKLLPVNITGNGALNGKTVTQIINGDFHSLALCSDGTLTAWGYNDSGQLGTGDSTSQSLPVAITSNGILNGKTVTQIVGGGYHTLALANVDSAKPTITETTPFTDQNLLIPAFKSGSITGTATDDVGVVKVEMKLTRLRNGVTQVWNGTAFTTATARIPATLSGPATNVNWTIDKLFPPQNQLDAGQYLILMTATDAAGNASSVTTRVNLYTSDAQTPITYVNKPTLNQKILLPDFTTGAISGTATDNLGIATIRIKLSRKRGTNYYWNGTAFTTSQFLLNATVTPVGGSTVKWNLDSQMPPASALDSGLYQVDVYAVDIAGNKSATITRPFTLGTDFTTPSVAITAPTSGQKIGLSTFGAGTINGTAGDNIGVTSVKLKLSRKRGTITTYWNGTAWTTATATVDATLSTVNGTDLTWTFDSQFPTAASGLDTGAYTLYATATDAAGLTKTSSSRSFTLTAAAPIQAPKTSSAAGS